MISLSKNDMNFTGPRSGSTDLVLQGGNELLALDRFGLQLLEPRHLPNRVCFSVCALRLEVCRVCVLWGSRFLTCIIICRSVYVCALGLEVCGEGLGLRVCGEGF